ncbi:MAG TPA: biotin/lipoyl-containing protein [Thermodesulfobacteriota bacterium]|nr:biotin/lipoyl-containing protein [Thermodesulfobacteriota bacterium]
MTYSFKHDNQIYKLNFENDGGNLTVELEDSKKKVEFKKLDDYLYSIIINGKSHNLAVMKKGKEIQVFYQGNIYNFEAVSELEQARGGAAGGGANQITAPMPSRIVKLLKGEGDAVEEGEGVIVVEAMKMESELKASLSGTVKDIKVAEGDTVEGGAVLVVLSAE